MVYKLNISDKGKAWKIESESTSLNGKSLGDKVEGKLFKSELEGYELEITGGSDISGFPMYSGVEGLALKGVLLKKGWGMHEKRDGLRKRKTVRGKTISPAVVQINLKVVKSGPKALAEIFPEQNKPKEEKSAEQNTKPAE